MPNLEQITINATIFIILLSAYGVTSNVPGVTSAIQTVFGPWPSFGQQVKSVCSQWDISCQAGSVAQATAQIAAAISFPAALFGSLLGRISAFGSVIGILFGGGEFAPGGQGVPFLAIFASGVALVGFYEVFRLFRGNASTGTL
jgi:hypothetical protein